MRAYLPGLELVAPADLGDALALLAAGEHRPFAGGTDLMVLAEAGKLPWRRFVSLWQLRELRGIEIGAQTVTIGALTTYTDVRRSAPLQEEFPLLGRAAAETGGIAIQNRGTLGGNVANASPAADTPPALLVYDAELELLSPRGSRRVPYADFHRGYRAMDLQPGEIIARIHLPRRRAAAGGAAWRDAYRKVGTRRAQAISKLCFAGALRVEGDLVADVRLAWGSVAPIPLRSLAAEAAVRGQPLSPRTIEHAVAALRADLRPIDDFRSTAEYRLGVAEGLLRAFLESGGGAAL